MVGFNESAFETVSDISKIPYGDLQEFVRISDCKAYVAHVSTMNYVFMGLCILAIIVMFVVLFKRGAFDKEKEKLKEMNR